MKRQSIEVQVSNEGKMEEAKSCIHCTKNRDIFAALRADIPPVMVKDICKVSVQNAVTKSKVCI